MFVLPLVAFPFLLALAAYRLYVLPRRMAAGQLRFAKARLSLRTAITLLAYLALLGYTVTLVVFVPHTLVRSQVTPALLLSTAPLFAGYPFVYVAAEWVFYYGFMRPPKPKHYRHE